MNTCSFLLLQQFMANLDMSRHLQIVKTYQIEVQMLYAQIWRQGHESPVLLSQLQKVLREAGDIQKRGVSVDYIVWHLWETTACSRCMSAGVKGNRCKRQNIFNSCRCTHVMALMTVSTATPLYIYLHN